MSPADLLHKFIKGLKPAVQKEVELRDPKTWEEAVRTAERADNVLYSFTKPQGTNSVPSKPVKMDLNASEVVQSQPRETRTCHYCKKPGHLIKDCRKMLAKASRKQNSAQLLALRPCP